MLETEQVKIGGHKIILYVDNHVVLTCAACDKTHIIPLFSTSKKESLRYAYGRLLEEKCEIREGPEKPQKTETQQAKLL